MIADTNLVLRAIDNDGSNHSKRARQRIQESRSGGQRIRLLASTVGEIVFVLRSKRAGYNFTRAQVVEVLTIVIGESAFDIEERLVLAHATRLYEDSTAGFHDCYLAAVAQLQNDQVLSFDRDLHKLGVGAEP